MSIVYFGMLLFINFKKNYIIFSFIDCRSGKCVKTIIPESGLKAKEALSWVGCIALDTSESWLVSFFLNISFYTGHFSCL